MHYLISFESNNFDLDNEEPNPINPIRGKSVGGWMAGVLKNDGVQVTEVDAEDWGWYLYATYAGNRYLIGFSANPAESDDAAPEILIQIDKSRSFFDILTGKNKMTADDPLLTRVYSHIKCLKDTAKIEIMKNA